MITDPTKLLPEPKKRVTLDEYFYGYDDYRHCAHNVLLDLPCYSCKNLKFEVKQVPDDIFRNHQQKTQDIQVHSNLHIIVRDELLENIASGKITLDIVHRSLCDNVTRNITADLRIEFNSLLKQYMKNRSKRNEC